MISEGKKGGGRRLFCVRRLAFVPKTMFNFCPRLLWFVPPSTVHDHPGLCPLSIDKKGTKLGSFRVLALFYIIV